jgi:hypothetical protein
MIHHKDIKFFLTELDRLGKERGCHINPQKTRILTSCNHTSILPELNNTSRTIANNICDCLHKYSHSINKQTGEIISEEITDGFRLLGTPVGSETFAHTPFTLNNYNQSTHNATY